MLTPRAWVFLVVALAFTAGAIYFTVISLTLVGLTLLGWFLATWLTFVVRLRLTERSLFVVRRLRDKNGPVHGLWARSEFTVQVELCCDGFLGLPYVRVADRLPILLDLVGGSNRGDGPVRRDQPLRIEYDVQCRAAGVIRFEGLSVEVVDVQGLFVQHIFVPALRTYRVLPALADAKGHMPVAKRHNLIPLLGAHRFARPGSGSELLDLRDYLPGDPPKTIAWKVSARRDRLMTKEFESEVPVRCTLLVDISNAVRVGIPGDNALARVVEIAAAVAQASAASRDLTGLCLCDEHGVHIVRPARGRRHLVTLMNQLAAVAALLPEPVDTPVARVLPLGYALAQELYPEAMQADVNRFPWWLGWLWPKPAYTFRRPKMRARALWRRPGVWLRRRLRYFRLVLRQAVVARLSPHYRRYYRWRKQLAALLSVKYGLPPGGLAVLLEDDRQFGHLVQRFLAEHHVPAGVPFYDADGRYLFAGPGKIDKLAQALLRAVARGRDNELFVLLADLLESGDHLSKLLAAVKVAVARHHQVMVVCPWPPDVPLPKDAGSPAATDAKRASPLAALAWKMTVQRFHQAFFALRRTFANLGVTVLCAPSEDSVSLILNRLERLRALARGVR